MAYILEECIAMLPSFLKVLMIFTAVTDFGHNIPSFFTKSQTQLKQLSTHIHYSSVYFVDGSKEFKVEKDMRTSYIMAVCYCQNGPGTC